MTFRILMEILPSEGGSSAVPGYPCIPGTWLPRDHAGLCSSASSDWSVVTRAVARWLSPALALALSEPVPGPSGTCWRTPLPGSIFPLRELQGHAREEARAVAGRTAGELARLARKLSGFPDTASKASAVLVLAASDALFAAAGELAGSGTIFVVGGVPVLAGWDLSSPSGVVPLACPAVPGTPMPVRPGSSFPSTAAASPGASSNDKDGGSSVISAAFVAVAVFLIALALFWLLAPGFRTAAGAVGSAPLDPGPDPGLASSLSSELASLKARYRGTLAACRSESEVTPDESAPTLPPPEVRDKGAPAVHDAPVPLEAAPPPPPPPAPPDPESSDKPKPEPSEKPKPKPSYQPKPKPPATPQAGQDLTIPPGAKDVGFLEGCWKADSGILDQVYRRPIDWEYCFTGSGNARLRITSATFTCSASGKAVLSGGKLRIKAGSAPCSRGNPTFNPSSIVCTPRTGAAYCTLQGEGGPVIQTRMTRRGAG
ncbi:MAG: hypothetical protein LBQ79_12630 [Deltaproteobacteria bacterium]|nr:hypothetical protein [Deltaproteobacteria bacterium]